MPMTESDQIARQLDGVELADLEQQDELLARARELDVVVLYASPQAVVITGALQSRSPHRLSGPLLMTRQGRLDLPDYRGKGVTDEHVLRMVTRGLGALVKIEAVPARAPFWALSASVPYSTFTLCRNGRDYCTGLAIAREDLPDIDRTKGFQQRTAAWVTETFGADHQADMRERCDRVIEEVLELMQSLGYPADAVERALRYVYGRDAGEPQQEVGGVMVTMAALCDAAGIDMHASGEIELTRVETVPHLVRAKQSRKPKFVQTEPRLALVQ